MTANQRFRILSLLPILMLALLSACNGSDNDDGNNGSASSSSSGGGSSSSSSSGGGGFPVLDPSLGTVDSHLINRLGVNRVYIFSGDVVPDDVDGNGIEPVITVDVLQVAGSCFFQYDATGLNPGDYTVAFTNQAADDDPLIDNAITFTGQTLVTVDASGSLAHNFTVNNVLRVGPGQTYTKPSEAAAVVNAGDVVEIEAGVYAGDATSWNDSNITIRGVNGRAHMKAEGAQAAGKGIWVTTGNNITIENIEFSEAAVPDENGAGIRAEGSNLTVCNSYFHDNENGILGGAYGTMIIEFSEFQHNGLGEFGRTHNIYVDSGNRLIFRYNYSHHTTGQGHNLKTRAEENYVLYNRLMDEINGDSSYALDVPNGGLTYLIGNLLQQSENTGNSTIFNYGSEGLRSGATHNLYVVNNTFVSDRSPPGSFANIAGGIDAVQFKNNLFVGGAGTPGGMDATNIVTNSPDFVDRNNFDYHLLDTSTAINKGGAPGSGDGFDLAPVWQYLHTASREQRPANGALDVGAFEYSP